MRRIFVLILVLVAPLLASAQQSDSVKVVNYGVRVSANFSQLTMRGIPLDIYPSRGVGAEGGLFLDFNIGPRFFIRFNTLYSFQSTPLTMDGRACPLHASSVEIPVFASWRFGNRHRGWGMIGVGPYTEFVVWGRLRTVDGSFNPYHHVIDVNADGQETFAMTDSHSGFGMLLGYELPCGLFADLTAQMALTDLLAFDHGGDMWVRPLKFTLGLGWRW